MRGGFNRALGGTVASRSTSGSREFDAECSLWESAAPLVVLVVNYR